MYESKFYKGTPNSNTDFKMPSENPLKLEKYELKNPQVREVYLVVLQKICLQVNS